MLKHLQNTKLLAKIKLVKREYEFCLWRGSCPLLQTAHTAEAVVTVSNIIETMDIIEVATALDIEAEEEANTL